MAYMLDTNAVSDLLQRQPDMIRHLAATEVGSVAISAITAGELYFGLAKRSSQALRYAVHQFLLRVRVEPWTDEVARTYGELRATLVAQGLTLAPLDMQIAAHARHLGQILVSRDRAFQRVPALRVMDWTQA